MATSSYVDGLKVKISEKYKPPCKISLPVTYSQRLALNKQILDNTPHYDFNFEESVVEKMRELKNARRAQVEDREKRIAEARLDFLERTDKEDKEKETSKEEVKTTVSKEAYSNPSILQPGTSILMPSPAPTYSNILTPVPLTNYGPSQSVNERKPFNISDFESDTSSPFDNMELKSINDLEALAQILKSESNNFESSSTVPDTSANYNNYGYNSYVPPTVSTYSHVNGYYYQPNSFGVGHSGYQHYQPIDNQQKSNCRSVPDIMKSLERELGNVQLENEPKYLSTSVPPKITETVYNKMKVKEDLHNPFDILPKDQQALCRSICSMGFPLARVARVCQIIGNDHKKIVEHLLALSDLLDLGFAEKDASSALLRNDNDRDRALDVLIS